MNDLKSELQPHAWSTDRNKIVTFDRIYLSLSDEKTPVLVVGSRKTPKNSISPMKDEIYYISEYGEVNRLQEHEEITSIERIGPNGWEKVGDDVDDNHRCVTAPQSPEPQPHPWNTKRGEIMCGDQIYAGSSEMPGIVVATPRKDKIYYMSASSKVSRLLADQNIMRVYRVGPHGWEEMGNDVDDNQPAPKPHPWNDDHTNLACNDRIYLNDNEKPVLVIAAGEEGVHYVDDNGGVTRLEYPPATKVPHTYYGQRLKYDVVMRVERIGPNGWKEIGNE